MKKKIIKGIGIFIGLVLMFVLIWVQDNDAAGGFILLIAVIGGFIGAEKIKDFLFDEQKSNQRTRHSSISSIKQFEKKKNFVCSRCHKELPEEQLYEEDTELCLDCSIAKKTNLAVKYEGQNIFIDSYAFEYQYKQNPYTFKKSGFMGVMEIHEKEPVLSLYENDTKFREYRLQTKDDENFTGKFFHICVRMDYFGNPRVPTALIEGFISDDSELRPFEHEDIGYRMEVYFLNHGGRSSKANYDLIRGNDLESKALKFVGYTTPGEYRLIGFCQNCFKSFTFNAYSVYLGGSEPVYSDDGLDSAYVTRYDWHDKEIWSRVVDEKTFRYYNSFNCPYCNAPYIDYRKKHEMKTFGRPCCVHLGKEPYNLDSLK